MPPVLLVMMLVFQATYALACSYDCPHTFLDSFTSDRVPTGSSYQKLQDYTTPYMHEPPAVLTMIQGAYLFYGSFELQGTDGGNTADAAVVELTCVVDGTNRLFQLDNINEDTEAGYGFMMDCTWAEDCGSSGGYFGREYDQYSPGKPVCDECPGLFVTTSKMTEDEWVDISDGFNGGRDGFDAIEWARFKCVGAKCHMKDFQITYDAKLRATTTITATTITVSTTTTTTANATTTKSTSSTTNTPTSTGTNTTTTSITTTTTETTTSITTTTTTATTSTDTSTTGTATLNATQLEHLNVTIADLVRDGMDVAELLSKRFSPIALVQAEGANITLADLIVAGISAEETAVVLKATSGGSEQSPSVGAAVVLVLVLVVLSIAIGVGFFFYRRKSARNRERGLAPRKGTNAAVHQRNATVKRHAVETVAMEANPLAKANANASLHEASARVTAIPESNAYEYGAVAASTTTSALNPAYSPPADELYEEYDPAGAAAIKLQCKYACGFETDQISSAEKHHATCTSFYSAFDAEPRMAVEQEQELYYAEPNAKRPSFVVRDGGASGGGTEQPTCQHGCGFVGTSIELLHAHEATCVNFYTVPDVDNRVAVVNDAVYEYGPAVPATVAAASNPACHEAAGSASGVDAAYGDGSPDYTV